MRQIHAVLLACLLSGCVTQQNPQPTTTTTPFDPAAHVVTTPPPKRETNPAIKLGMQAYANCSRAAATIISSQGDDPASLAVATLGFCGKEAGILRAALTKEFADPRTPFAAKQVMDNFEATLIKSATSWIVQDRMRSQMQRIREPGGTAI